MYSEVCGSAFRSQFVQVLLSKITDFQEILPIIENLRKPSIKPRHWQEVMAITKTNFPYERENFSLANIMDSPILKFKDDVEEVRGYTKNFRTLAWVWMGNVFRSSHSKRSRYTSLIISAVTSWATIHLQTKYLSRGRGENLISSGCHCPLRLLQVPYSPASLFVPIPLQ